MTRDRLLTNHDEYLVHQVTDTLASVVSGINIGKTDITSVFLIRRVKSL